MLAELYESLEDISVETEFNSDFLYWHFEAMLGFGAQLVQRASDERDEYYQLMLQRIGAEDLIRREELEYEALVLRTDQGLKRGEEIRTDLDQKSRSASNSDFHAAYAQADRQYDKTRTQIDIAFNEANRDGLASLRDGYAAERNFYQQTYIPKERERLDAKTRSIDYLDFQYRMQMLADRIRTGIQQATSCLSQASIGLETILGYDVPLRNYVAGDYGIDAADPDRGQVNAVDRLLNWTREANFWLSRFMENDQQFTKSFSLLHMLGEGFGEAIALAKASDGVIRFALPIESHHFAHRMVRVRGLSLYLANASKGYQSWEAEISVPRSALIHMPHFGPIQIEQTKYPSVLFGRILTRTSPFPADVMGGISIGNASPISGYPSVPWDITLRPLNKAQLDDLFDLELEVHLTGQPQLGA